MESHSRPENLDTYFKSEKCCTEIWIEMLQSKTRSEDLKTQKLQGCILKAAGVIPQKSFTHSLMVINLKNSKILSPHDLRNSYQVQWYIYELYIGSLALLCLVLWIVALNKLRDKIVYYLDNLYHTLQNVPSESEFLFGKDLPKRIMILITNKKLFSMPLAIAPLKYKKRTCINSFNFLWVPKELLWSIPKTLQQQPRQQQQAPKAKEKSMNLIGPPGF